VSNDALVVLAGSAVTYLVVRVLTGDMRWRTAALLGLVQGIGLFAKSIPLLALPMIAAAYLLATGSPLAERLRKGAFVALVAFGSGGWWWARNLVEFGTIQPTGVDPAAPSSFDPGLGAFLPQGLDLLLRRTIGDPTAFWPTPVAYAVAVATVVLVLLALRMRRTRRVLLVILSFWVIAMVMIVVNSYAYYRGSGLISGLNGRYAFGGIAGVAVAVGVGLSTLLPERRARQVSAGIAGVTAVISAYGLWSGLGRFERLSGISSLPGALRRWSDWTPLAGGELAAVVALDVLAALGCLLVVLRLPIESRTAFGNHLPGDDPARVDLGDSAVSPPDGDHRPD
jgi:hypothetical protein